MHPLRLLALPLLCAAAAAQTVWTSPPGAFHLEGNSSSGVLWGTTSNYQCRVQQAESNFVGEARLPLVRSLAWRRNWPGLASAVARTADILVLLAHTDYATFTNVYANNYKTPPVTVFARRTINLPPWLPLTGTPPAPFDLLVPFDVPFVYNRLDAFVWEVQVFTTSASGSYSDDWFSTAAANDWSMTLQEQPGCTTANGAFRKRDGYRTSATALDVGWEVRGGPASAPVTLLLGTQLANLPVGLCAPLGLQPLLMVPLGTTDAAGNLPLGAFSVAWNPTLARAELAAQAVAPDATQPGLPLALSNATRTVLPKVLGNPGINCKRTFTLNSSSATTGSSVTVTAVPTQYGGV
jgi:hypothetical protein